jgi:hypothetical protein
MLAVATPVALLPTLNVPPLVFVLTVNVLLSGYVVLPLSALNVNVLAFFAVVTVWVALLAA